MNFLKEDYYKVEKKFYNMLLSLIGKDIYLYCVTGSLSRDDITPNWSDIDILLSIEKMSFESFAISVSLDSIDPITHDNFRGYNGAFEKAINAIHLIVDSNIKGVIPSMRCTIQASQINEMDELVKYARELGCKRIGFSAIHPAGRAIEREDLWMSAEQKNNFLNNVYRLKEKFTDIKVSTTDPLKCLVSGKSDTGKHNQELVFDGCGAASITFNVNADGTMTPCALLDIPMMNVFPLSVEKITEHYQKNLIVKNMITMNFKGKCGSCKIKYQCGGCRARAFIQNDDYLGEDPHCWLK